MFNPKVESRSRELNVQVTRTMVRVRRRAGGPPIDAVAWLDDDQQRDWRPCAPGVTLPTAMDAQLKRDAGMNSFEYHVLAGLSMAPGRAMVLSDLAWLAQGSLSRLSHAISRMERAGWVERRTCNGAAGGSRRGSPTPGEQGGGRRARSRPGGAPAGGRRADARRAAGPRVRRPQGREGGGARPRGVRRRPVPPPARAARSSARAGEEVGQRAVEAPGSGVPDLQRQPDAVGRLLRQGPQLGLLGGVGRLDEPHDARVVPEVVVAELGVAVEAELVRPRCARTTSRGSR